MQSPQDLHSHDVTILLHTAREWCIVSSHRVCVDGYSSIDTYLWHLLSQQTPAGRLPCASNRPALPRAMYTFGVRCHIISAYQALPALDALHYATSISVCKWHLKHCGWRVLDEAYSEA